MDVLARIKAQIDAAQDDLHAYRPEPMKWHDRATSAADQLVPWLLKVAPAMRDYVRDILNAPVLLRTMWNTIREHVNLPKKQIEEFDYQLTLDDVLRESVTGEVVSKIITKFLL